MKSVFLLLVVLLSCEKDQMSCTIVTSTNYNALWDYCRWGTSTPNYDQFTIIDQTTYTICPQKENELVTIHSTVCPREEVIQYKIKKTIQ